MTTTYRPLAVPGVYLGEETFFKADVPLQRALVLVRYASPDPEKIVKYTQNLARTFLERPDIEPQNLAEKIMSMLPPEILEEIKKGEKYDDILKKYAFDFPENTRNNDLQTLQMKVSVLTPDIAEILERELRTGREYNELNDRKDVFESGSQEMGKVLISLRDWRLPDYVNMKKHLDNRVRNSDPLTIKGNYPYAEMRSMIESVYGFFGRGFFMNRKPSVEVLEDISLDMVIQYAALGLKEIHFHSMRERPIILIPFHLRREPENSADGKHLLEESSGKKDYGPN